MTQEGDSDKPQDKSADIGADEQPLADLVAQLRDANENLVLATLEAQSMREQAEALNPFVIPRCRQHFRLKNPFC